MKYRIYILALTLAVLATSCIKEKKQDCYGELDLYFSYHGDGATQIFDQKISNVNLFVFDENYDLIRQGTYDQAALAKNQGTTLTLAPGTYHILCAGNVYDKTVTCDMPNISSLSDIYFEHPKTSTGTISSCDPIFSSVKMVTVQDANGRYEETVEFESLHYRIRMEITGSDVDKNWSVQIREHIGRIYNDQKCEFDVTVIPETTFEPETYMLYSDFHVFRQPDNDFIFDFIDPDGELISSVNLFEFLERYPAIDLTKEEVYIPIRLQILKDEVGVVIPEWGIIEITPEW